jgi:hypothetical protein
MVAAFLFLAAAIAALVAVLLLFPNPRLDRIWEINKPGAAIRSLGKAAGFLLLALGAAVFAAAIGLLRRKRWAWWFAACLFLVDASGDAVSLAVTGDWLRSAAGIAISGAFLFALTRPRVRRYFKPAAPALP